MQRTASWLAALLHGEISGGGKREREKNRDVIFLITTTFALSSLLTMRCCSLRLALLPAFPVQPQCTTLKKDARAKVPLACIWAKRWIKDGKLKERVNDAATSVLRHMLPGHHPLATLLSRTFGAFSPDSSAAADGIADTSRLLILKSAFC